MRRRYFIPMVGGLLGALPLAALAQHTAMPVVGFLNSLSPAVWASYVAAFRQGLKQTGYIEGENVVVDYRWAENHVDRLPGLAAALVGRPVSVIVASGGDASMLAATQATATIPIVANFPGDPVEQRLVASLNRPAGNVTGVAMFSEILVAKRLELLHQLLPTVSTVAFLANPTSSYSTTYQKTSRPRQRSLDCKRSS
jgi:ABC-type uncharacterized transport system substrate-binding protein